MVAGTELVVTVLLLQQLQQLQFKFSVIASLSDHSGPGGLSLIQCFRVV
jgi:hypothetical protein